MRLPSPAAAVHGVVLLLLFWPFAVVLAVPGPLWLQPSANWLGIDGNWSTLDFIVGSKAAGVSLLVSTGLSEIWVVGSGGCPSSPLCRSARGGIFDPWESASWTSIGAWQLGLSDLGYGGNGDYGLETIVFSNTIHRHVTTVDNALVTAVNDTDYYQGYIGIGITDGRFNGRIANPLISQLAGAYDTIPSHSYGYTAGAYYADDGHGVPSSLVLGGYDSLRFDPHNVSFNYNPQQIIPQVVLRGISVTAAGQQPPNWNSTTQILLGFNATNSTANLAFLDSSTPYLWLPTAVCDAFAAALNLTWIEDYGVYVFSDDSQYNNFLQDPSFQFTFSLSSFDNRDSFGRPLSVPGVVNITITAAAFAQLLRYPFRGQFQFGDPAVPYFPLKRSDAGDMVIGRAFMQEAYMVMRYDVQTFSIYQARFPDNAATNYSLMALDKSGASYAPADTFGDSKLRAGQIAGIVIGAVGAICVVVITLCCCCCRRRKQRRPTSTESADAVKDDASDKEPEPPTSSLGKLFSLLRGRRRMRRRRKVHEVSGDSAHPVEVGNRELHELHAPQEPAELDGTGPCAEDETTGPDAEQTNGLSAYELARRKIERQLQRPAPNYASHHEKAKHDASPVACYRRTLRTDNSSPVSSPVSSPASSPASSPSYGNHSSMPSIPSPITPRFSDWQSRHFDLPSPMTVAPPTPSPPLAASRADGSYAHAAPNSPCSYYAPPLPSLPVPTRERKQVLASAPGVIARSHTSNRSVRSGHPTYSDQPSRSPVSQASLKSSRRSLEPPSMSRSSSLESPVSLVGPLFPPCPVYQRTPIDSSSIICLGPLPENVALPPPHSQPPTPSAAVSGGSRSVTPPPTIPASPLRQSSAHQSPACQTPSLPSPMAPDALLTEDPHPDESRRSSFDTLGSNFTVEEEARFHEQIVRQQSTRGQERIDGDFDMVHIPQVAERRYSWEEDRRR